MASKKTVSKKAPARARTVKAAAKRAPARKAAASIAAVRMATKINSDTLNEGMKTMNNQTNQAAGRVQAIFGDVNERAKTQIEKSSRVAGEMTELGKGNVEAIVAASKIAAKGVESLGQEAAEFGRKSFEEASAALKSFAEVKSPVDFFRLQSEFAKSQFESMIAESSKMSEAMMKLAGEVAQPLTNRYSVAAERVKSVVA